MREYNLNVAVWQEDNLFVALCLDVDVASQGYTREEALENLKEALGLYFEEEQTKDWTLPILTQPELLQVQVPAYA